MGRKNLNFRVRFRQNSCFWFAWGAFCRNESWDVIHSACGVLRGVRSQSGGALTDTRLLNRKAPHRSPCVASNLSARARQFFALAFVVMLMTPVPTPIISLT